MGGLSPLWKSFASYAARVAGRSTSGEEAQLRAVLAGMSEGVVAVDGDNHVVFSNEAALRMLGLDEGSFEQRRLTEVVHDPELDAVIEEARESERVAARELNVARGDKVVTMRVKASHLGAADEGGVVVVFDDISELKKLERIRSDFVANVSHELKTPLTSIRGYVETLLEGALHDEANNERFLKKVYTNVERLNHLVTDLLSLARIESPEYALHLHEVDWSPLIAKAVQLHEPTARERGIACQVVVPAAGLRVLGDPESMTQVIDNLLDNAIKYTPRGGNVTLRLSPEGAVGVLEVADTGLGIPPEHLERIFERFYRVDKARSRALGGTGLGLAIVKHLVQAMHGEMSVKSEPERGSRFRVLLPLA